MCRKIHTRRSVSTRVQLSRLGSAARLPTAAGEAWRNPSGLTAFARSFGRPHGSGARQRLEAELPSEVSGTLGISRHPDLAEETVGFSEMSSGREGLSQTMRHGGSIEESSPQLPASLDRSKDCDGGVEMVLRLAKGTAGPGNPAEGPLRETGDIPEP